FLSLFLFDAEARAAVERGSTIFDFRHPIGPCLTFNPNEPDDGIACDKEWLLAVLGSHGLEVELIKTGNWRQVRAYEISQDYVVACKRSPSVSIPRVPKVVTPTPQNELVGRALSAARDVARRLGTSVDPVFLHQSQHISVLFPSIGTVARLRA